MRALVLRAVGRPEAPETITPEQRAWFYRFALLVACLAIVVDLGMGALLRQDPRIDSGVLGTFVAINVPILVALAVAASWLSRHPGGGNAALVPLIIAAQVTVMVWIQVTGTLTSYFVVRPRRTASRASACTCARRSPPSDFGCNAYNGS